MTIRTPKQALVIATGTRVNIEGMCQAVTRGYYLAPSAGDIDGDGDADAYDGWLSEPKAAKHIGDRNPPAGYPVSFRGGSRGHGHRAISLGGGRIRSTDFDGLTKRYRAGVLGNGTIAEVEHAMNVTYLGWSETIDGQPIPKDAPPPPVIEKPQEDPMLAKVRDIVARIKHNLYNPDKHWVDLDDLEQLIKLGHQPEAAAAKDFRNQIKAATTAFGTEVKW